MINIDSAGTGGTQFRVTISKTEAQAGTVRVRSWKTGLAVEKPPTSDDTTRLYGLRSAPDGTKLVGRARVIGPDPEVTFSVGSDVINVTVVGAILGNGSTDYPVTAGDATRVAKFIADSGFPAL